MDFVLLPKTEILLKPGKLFIEARIRADARDNFDSGSIAEVSDKYPELPNMLNDILISSSSSLRHSSVLEISPSIYWRIFWLMNAASHQPSKTLNILDVN
jgi:hypothetical protein